MAQMIFEVNRVVVELFQGLVLIELFDLALSGRDGG